MFHSNSQLCRYSSSIPEGYRRCEAITAQDLFSDSRQLLTTALSRHGQMERKGTTGNRKESDDVVCGGVVQLVRTPARHAGGRAFESRRSPHFCRAGVVPRKALLPWSEP